MALKLTILLVGVIFLTLYFAGGRDGPATGRIATVPAERAPAQPAPAQPAPAQNAPEVAPASPQPEVARSATAPAATDVVPAPEAAEARPDAGAPTLLTDDTATLQDEIVPAPEEDAPLLLPGLGMSGLSLNSGSDAVSLADGVRARIAAEPTQPLRRPEAPSAQTPEPASADQPEIAEGGGGTGPMARVTANSVNLRAGPSTAEAVVGRVANGDLLEVLGTSVPGWSAVRDPASGDTVYMSTQFLLMQPN